MPDSFGNSCVVLRHRQASQVADHEQRVRIDGIGMEQVVLHATDDAAECGDVPAQHAVVVHAAQFVGHAHRRAEDFQEQAVVARVLAELLVDQPQVPRHEAHRRGTHAEHVRVLLQQDEQFQQGRRGSREDVRAGGLQVFTADLEPRVQRLRLAYCPAGFRRGTPAAAVR